jgi:hypothetical protein
MIHGAYHYAGDGCANSNDDIGVCRRPYSATSWVKEYSSTNAMRPKMNMKVVIPNMNILGGDDNKPRSAAREVDLASVRPYVVHKGIVETHRRMWTETT